MAYINQRQMETLASTLKPSVKKKGKTTQGKVVPVPKRQTPYKPPKPPKRKPVVPPMTQTTGTQNANQLGAQKQQQAIESRAPVSTALNISYESDPVLARIKALGTQDVANARSEADALRKKAIIESGLTDVGAEIGVDPATIQAAQANPFSTSATIQREQALRGRELDEQLNQGNLFYSGHRATQLEDLARSGAQQQAALNSDIRSLLGGINQGITSAEQEAARQEQMRLEQIAEDQRQAALEQAYLDALYGGDLAGSDGGGITDQLGAAATDYYPEGYGPIAYSPEYVPTPEEELLLALGAGAQGFANYAI